MSEEAVKPSDQEATRNIMSNIANLLKKGMFFGEYSGHVAEAIAFCERSVAAIEAQLPKAETPGPKLVKTRKKGKA